MPEFARLWDRLRDVYRDGTPPEALERMDSAVEALAKQLERLKQLSRPIIGQLVA